MVRISRRRSRFGAPMGPYVFPVFRTMDYLDKQTLDRSQRVRVARQEYAAEVSGFGPLKETFAAADGLTDELEKRESEQNADTMAETQGKDAWREVVARKADTLSKQAVPWAMMKGTVTQKIKLRVSYTDLRYGEADADMDAARELVAGVRAIPAADQAMYRIQAGLATEVEAAVRAFEQAEDAQTGVKQNVQLATLAIPELARQLRGLLVQAKLLIGGQKDASARWGELNTKFNAANKALKAPGERRAAKTARVVKRLSARGAAEETLALDDQNYPARYEVRVENVGTADLRLWLGLEPDGAPQGTPVMCPAGMKRTFRRSELGPETARRLMGQLVGSAGEAKVVVRRTAEALGE